MKVKRYLFFIAILLLMSLGAKAQLTGYITDEETGEFIPRVSVSYKGHRISAISDTLGVYRIARHDGWQLTFSAVGYETKTIKITAKTPSSLSVKLKYSEKQLGEVVVKAKRSRYSRKENPAVILMRKVIENKKLTELKTNDYYQYDKYQKMTFAANDIQQASLDSAKGVFAKIPAWKNYVERCKFNDKLILPITVSETVSQKIYRKDPHAEKEIIKAEKTEGLNQVFEAGEFLATVWKDYFSDVNIYDDQIRLLQKPITSPIGKDAIAFYRFYIIDSLDVAGDSCIQVHFMPNNQQDFGFRGDIYILKDGSYQVKRCEMTLPKNTGVNFVEAMHILQEFTLLDNGQRVLTTDDLIVELTLLDFIQKTVVIRNTRLSDYAFNEIPPQMFKGKQEVKTEYGSNARSEEYWAEHRQVELTQSEEKISDMVDDLKKAKGLGIFTKITKVITENFIETGSKDKPSKVDIGPVNSMFSSNFIDGLRTRLSIQTTASLHPHLFFKGFIARGWKSKTMYYSTAFTWSLNKKEHLPGEFPMRNITFTSTYDVMSPADKFVSIDKDNVFTSWKWAKVDKMMFYNRQQLTFQREEEWGLRTTVSMKIERNEPAGKLLFVPLSTGQVPDYYLHSSRTMDAQPLSALSGFRTTELFAEIRYAPGEKVVNTKQRRRQINRDAPVFTLSHAIGFKGVFGGNYSYNFTEATFFRRLWFKSWGRLDIDARAGIQWNKVPFPLLISPNTNLSYIMQEFQTFALINNMEFLNDRYASVDLMFFSNGKILNRIPGIKKLKWREHFGFRVLWGALSDKNNPTLPENAGDPVLMYFPEGVNVMNPSKPYMEWTFGIHNIFRFFQIEYVGRLNYNDLPTAHKHGVRFRFKLEF